MSGEAADLQQFLESAGRSLGEAQGALTGGSADVPMAIAISGAELELKTLVETQADGRMAVKPVSGSDARVGRIAPEALSTVTIRYVAVADGAPRSPTSAAQRSADSVVGEVRSRRDVAALERILGGLQIQAAFVASTRRWLVTVTDPAGSIVREVVVADAKPTTETSKER